MGDSYREFLQEQQAKVSKVRKAGAITPRAEVKERAAVRAEYFRKSRARFNAQDKRQGTLWPLGQCGWTRSLMTR